MAKAIRNPSTMGIQPEPCSEAEMLRQQQLLWNIVVDMHNPDYLAGIQNGDSEIPTDDFSRPEPGRAGGLQLGMIIGQPPQNLGWNGPPEFAVVNVIPFNADGDPDPARVIDVLVPLPLASAPDLPHNAAAAPRDIQNRIMGAPAAGEGNLILFAPIGAGRFAAVGPGAAVQVIQWGVIAEAPARSDDDFWSATVNPTSCPTGGSNAASSREITIYIPTGPGLTPELAVGDLVGYMPACPATPTEGVAVTPAVTGAGANIPPEAYLLRWRFDSDTNFDPLDQVTGQPLVKVGTVTRTANGDRYGATFSGSEGNFLYAPTVALGSDRDWSLSVLFKPDTFPHTAPQTILSFGDLSGSTYSFELTLTASTDPTNPSKLIAYYRDAGGGSGTPRPAVSSTTPTQGTLQGATVTWDVATQTMTLDFGGSRSSYTWNSPSILGTFTAPLLALGDTIRNYDSAYSDPAPFDGQIYEPTIYNAALSAAQGAAAAAARTGAQLAPDNSQVIETAAKMALL
jgi:hypothetical protein